MSGSPPWWEVGRGPQLRSERTGSEWDPEGCVRERGPAGVAQQGWGQGGDGRAGEAAASPVMGWGGGGQATRGRMHMGAVRGAVGGPGETRAAPQAGLRSRPPTFPGSSPGPTCPRVRARHSASLWFSLPRSSQMRRTGVSSSSEDPSNPSRLQITLLFGAFLQDHRSGGERALGSFRDTGCITEPLLSNFCWSCGKGNVLSERIPQRMNTAAATSCCEES